jgi:acyl carrier protein
LRIQAAFPTGAAVQQGKARHPARDGDESVETAVRGLLAEVLGLPRKRVDTFDTETELFGALPEFDSMAVATFLTGLEERLDVLVEDDDVEAEDFMTFGRLLAFAERKAASAR